MRSSSLVILIAILLPMLGAQLVAGQEATPDPAAGPFVLPMAPPPELCTLPARAIEEYQAFVGTPEATNLPAIEIAAGSPADQAIIDGVTRTMVQFFACLNAGDYLRLGGAYTDFGFVEDSGSNGITQEVVDFIASPPLAVPVERRDILWGLYAVQVLADGRVAAVMQRGTDGMGGVNLMIFAEEDGRWLIDLWVDEPFVIRPNFDVASGEESTPSS
jgi:hypothetical protein